ncbi:unnamed protein product, partial [Arabidopsis halleri]
MEPDEMEKFFRRIIRREIEELVQPVTTSTKTPLLKLRFINSPPRNIFT